MSVANSASKENNDTHSEEGLARKKSDPDTLRKNFGDSMLAAELPWGSMKVVPLSSVEYVTSPSLFAAKIVMCELFNAFERKLQSITHEDALVRHSVHEACCFVLII
ncbi:hypothetical protein AB6A40_011119 [Gnathostoma spinigerum]|uniref:Uncharacterized protein n=1 Tax=Gnathostoma spinigerum TaxID=75299 RepID=A0ABD6EWU0_9BILA